MRKIKDWPEAERPREKLLKNGPMALSNAELLALVLRTGDAASQASAVDQARQLLTRFHSLRGLARATIVELSETKGIGPAKAAEVQAVFELARRFGGEDLQPGARYTCSAEVYRHFHERLRDYRKEVFIALLLDSKNRVLREVRISEGSLNASIVHPREVFAPVVRESAAPSSSSTTIPPAIPPPAAKTWNSPAVCAKPANSWECVSSITSSSAVASM